jgi:hypothetical protein
MRLCACSQLLWRENDQAGRISMPKLLPGIVGFVIASESSSPEAVLVLKLRTESGRRSSCRYPRRGQTGPKGHNRRVRSQSPVCQSP